MSGVCLQDFTLKSDSGTSVTLSDFRGKQNVVIFFYPADSTPGEDARLGRCMYECIWPWQWEGVLFFLLRERWNHKARLD